MSEAAINTVSARPAQAENRAINNQKTPDQRPQSRMGKAVERVKSIIQNIGIRKKNPDAALHAIVEDTKPNPIVEGKQDTGVHQLETKESSLQAMQAHEAGYITDHPKMKGLDSRYSDPSTEMGHVQDQVTAFAANAGLQHEQLPPELENLQLADSQAEQVILERAQQQVDRLFNSDQGTRNQEKHETVRAEVTRYVQLMKESQAQGDIPANLDAQTVLRLVEENVWKLAYQDRAASENLLGDHGVRHLVGHNIRVSELLYDQLEAQGQEVRAVDRLMTHQVMIDHDLGYAMDIVRDPIKAGQFGADAGHNVLAAKYIRQRASDPNNDINRVFSQQQLTIIHEGILHHDSADIDFSVGDGTQQARENNIYSTIHTADNTHAFEDKLPELLYTHPDTLRIMRLMKTAGEIGGAEGQQYIDDLRLQLIEGIRDRHLAPDDEASLINAANIIQPESYKKTAPRICGNKPEYQIDSTGRLTVTVEESAIHREVAGVFDQGSLDQLGKFIGDVTREQTSDFEGKTSVSSANERVTIAIRTGQEGRATEPATDYQQRVSELLKSDPEFVSFVIEDSTLSNAQRATEAQLKKAQADGVEETSESYQSLQQELADIKARRTVDLQNITNSQSNSN